MDRRKRKIGFYYLTVNNGRLKDSFELLIDSILQKDKTERIYDLGNNRFCFLESYVRDRNLAKIIIKNAKHSYRPNLLHRNTLIERENPKEYQEGDSEKAHLAIKVNDNDDSICFILDKHSGGITVKQLISYFNYFCNNIQLDNTSLRFGYEIVVKEDFLSEIENLNRVICAEILTDKQILGSEALNYSNRLNQVKHDITITVRAKKQNSIAEFATDIFTLFNGGEQRISKIRIIGRNDDNNEVVLKTDFIERIEFIMAEFNELTGELSSSDVFNEMYTILEGFN